MCVRARPRCSGAVDKDGAAAHWVVNPGGRACAGRARRLERAGEGQMRVGASFLQESARAFAVALDAVCIRRAAVRGRANRESNIGLGLSDNQSARRGRHGENGR